jgi:hypothetical protein
MDTKPQPKFHKASLLLITLFLGLLGATIFVSFVQAVDNSALVEWTQVNADGFGDASNQLATLAVYNGQLYAGTWTNDTAEVWRTSDGSNWSQFSPSWSVSTVDVYDIEPFNQKLYFGTSNDNGAEIWRTDGITWELVVTDGFTSTNNIGINALLVYSDSIYAATNNQITGLELWRSPSGDSSTWAPVFNAGVDAPANNAFTTLDIYNDDLYLGISRNSLAELWRTDDGLSWAPVFTNGLGNTNNTMVSSMEVFNGDFYIGLRNVTDGGQVWRSSDGTNWANVLAGGSGDIANSRPYGLKTFGNQLYLVFANTNSGSEVWRTTNGNQWNQVVSGGWGDSNNYWADYLDKGAEVFRETLYISAGNEVTGVEIWQLLYPYFFPFISQGA